MEEINKIVKFGELPKTYAKDGKHKGFVEYKNGNRIEVKESVIEGLWWKWNSSTGNGNPDSYTDENGYYCYEFF